MITLWLDTETYSEVPISYGTYVYAENCEVDIISFALDDDDVTVLDVANGDSIEPFLAALKTADVYVAHNAMFDRNVLRLGNLGIETDTRKWRCSMVRALAHGLPGSLDKLGEIVGLPEDAKKLKEGYDLVSLFCKPRPKNQKIRRATKATHPEKWARYLGYAKNDIVAMRAISKRLPSWNYTFDLPGQNRPRDQELALWHLDQDINDRGYLIDIDLVHGALRAVGNEQARLKARTQEITGYDGAGAGLESTSQRDKMLRFLLEEHGIVVPDLRGPTLEKMLETYELDDGVRELIRTRLQASSTSTSKYKALARGVSRDNRMRGTIQFDGASRTRRAAGRTFQPQNLPSRGLLKQKAIELGIQCILDGSEDLIFDDVMLLTTSTIRGTIIAPPGRKLVVADLSNIEGRGLAWLANEPWKLEAFREFDTVRTTDGQWLTGPEYFAACLAREYPVLELDGKGEPVRRGPDLYKLAYAKSFNIDVAKVGKAERQVGKVQELALGYQGGVSAFLTFADAYGIDLEEMAKTAWDVLPLDVRAESATFIDWLASKGTRYPMSREAAITCDVFKRLWRAAHPKVVRMWDDLETGFRLATEAPGETFIRGRFKFRRDQNWLRIVLPSGRALCYPSPQVADDGQCSYMGVDQYTRQWKRIKTYGGKLAENCLAEGTLVLTAAGWLPIQDITSRHVVWDGEEWVSHSGCVYKGKQVVSSVFGVEMTPDHRVLTEEGWKDASSCEGHIRAPCRLPYGYTLPRIGREEVSVGGRVRLREDRYSSSIRTEEDGEEGSEGFLWMQTKSNYSRPPYQARNVPTSGLRGVEKHARQMPAAHAPSVEKLRRAWDSGVRAVANLLRKLLGGHGPDVHQGVEPGEAGQRAGVLPGELRLAIPEAPGEQHPGESENRNSEREDDSRRSSEVLRSEILYASVPAGPWLAERATVRAVYDLLDCGPRNRFVVLGTEGPLIVHNCTQSFARDLLFDSMPNIEAAGYDIVLHVHDEVITETPDTPEYDARHLAAIMSTPPDYAPDIPLAAAGYEAYRYRKD